MTVHISLTEFYSGIDGGELSGKQTYLLQLFAKVPESKKQLIFELLRSLSEDKK